MAKLIESSKEQTEKRRDCPFILECNALVTMHFFFRICGSSQFQNCHHYARKKDELKTPLIWLQKKAIKNEGKNREKKLTKIFQKKVIK